MKATMTMALLAAMVALAGCDERQVHADHGSDHEHHGDDFVPYLKAYHLIDSYGVDTAVDYETALTLDPYHDAGIFEIDWQVNSLEDYQVSFRMNDRPSLSGSIPVYTEICGAGLPCDQDAIRICQYYSDLTMACGLDEYITDISPLIEELPQKAYAVLEVCDTDSSYCEYDYYPVWLE
ncbi:hypothetical protein [Marinimicrobium locisalis]|uniref:hypothetical protein n=1 Tax=Marinimicrobium locisalis TaxID=546022 RepID=UPI003221ECD0